MRNIIILLYQDKRHHVIFVFIGSTATNVLLGFFFLSYFSANDFLGRRNALKVETSQQKLRNESIQYLKKLSSSDFLWCLTISKVSKRHISSNLGFNRVPFELEFSSAI